MSLNGQATVIGRNSELLRSSLAFPVGVTRTESTLSIHNEFRSAYNVTGAITWVLSFLLAGYWFGQLPAVKRNFHIVIVAIIIISVMPMVVEYLRARRSGVPEPGSP